MEIGPHTSGTTAGQARVAPNALSGNLAAAPSQRRGGGMRQLTERPVSRAFRMQSRTAGPYSYQM